MKKSLFLAVFAAALCLSGCQKIDVADDVQQESSAKSKEVQFVMKGITEEYSTRATLASVNMTDLWVWEGTTLLAHMVSTASDFDTPTLSLTYGSHDLTFVASKADGQTWANGMWSTTKEWDTFSTTMNVTVSANSSNSRQVQLTRRSAKVKFQTEDNVPTGVKTVHLTVGNHKSLDKDLKGGTAYTHEATVDMTSKVGSTYTVAVNVLTESATDEEDTEVMIEFLDGSTPAKVLYHYERVVKLKPNRCVSLTGSYFSGSSNSITIASTEWDNVNQSLFE